MTYPLSCTGTCHLHVNIYIYSTQHLELSMASNDPNYEDSAYLSVPSTSIICESGSSEEDLKSKDTCTSSDVIDVIPSETKCQSCELKQFKEARAIGQANFINISRYHIDLNRDDLKKILLDSGDDDIPKKYAKAREMLQLAQMGVSVR